MNQRQVTFQEAVQRAILQNYCNFESRASRSEYWWFALFSILLSAAISIIFGYGSLGEAISGLATLALLLPSIGLTVRRLHDMGKSGWWIFISFIPLVGAIILIVWLCQPSIPIDNEFGPVPNVEY